MKCLKCGLIIKGCEHVYGDPGQYMCANCYKPNIKEVFSKDKRNFYKNRASWNKQAEQSMKAITDKIKGSTYAK